MPDIDVAALRVAAEGATPGDWAHVTDDHGRGWLDHSVWSELGECYVVERLAGPDAAYIAAADPAVVLELLDRLAAAEGAVARVPAVVASAVHHVARWPRPQAARAGRVVQMVMENLQGQQIKTEEQP